MIYNVIVGLLVAGTCLGLIFLKTNAALIFLVLLAGTMLVNTLDSMLITNLRGLIEPTEGILSLVRVLITVLPAFAVALLHRKHTGKHLFMQLFPALSCGIVTLFIIVPLLPTNTQHNVANSSLYLLIKPYNTMTLVLGFISSLIAIMLIHRARD